MKLWSDEIEAMRPEARDAVANGMEAMRAMIGNRAAIDPTLDKFVRAKQQREMFALGYVTAPEAVERDIAGVRCRVFVPEQQPARAVYLHFHGGGMILGAPEMNDVANLELCRRTAWRSCRSTTAWRPSTPTRPGPTTASRSRRGSSSTPSASSAAARLLTGGESAGGYMAAAVLLRIRDELRAADRCRRREPRVRRATTGAARRASAAIRPHAGPDILDPDGHRVLRRVLPAGTQRRRAPRPGDLARVRRPARPAAGADERRDDRPPARRHADARGALGRGRQRGRALRRARHAARLRGRTRAASPSVAGAHTRWFDDILARPGSDGLTPAPSTHRATERLVRPFGELGERLRRSRRPSARTRSASGASASRSKS